MTGHHPNGRTPQRRSAVDDLGADLIRILGDEYDDRPAARRADGAAAWSHPENDPASPDAVLTFIPLPLTTWWMLATLIEQGAKCWAILVSWPGLMLAHSISVTKATALDVAKAM